MPGSPHEARTQRQWAPPSPVAYSAYGLDPAAPSLELKRTQAALGAAHSSSADGSKVNSRSGGAKLGRAPQLRPPSVERHTLVPLATQPSLAEVKQTDCGDAVAGVHQPGRLDRQPGEPLGPAGDAPALAAAGEVDAPQRAHPGLTELALVLAAVDGSEQGAVADRPTGRCADEVDGVQVLGATPDADPGPPAVAGAQDGALANRKADLGADGLDRLQRLDAAQWERGSGPRRLGRGTRMVLPGTHRHRGGGRGCRAPPVGRCGLVGGGAGEVDSGSRRGGGEHHGDGDTNWSHGDLPQGTTTRRRVTSSSCSLRGRSCTSRTCRPERR